MKKAMYSCIAALIISGSATAQTWERADIKKAITDDPLVVATSDGGAYMAGFVSGKTRSVNLYRLSGKTITKVYEPDFVKQHEEVSLTLDANEKPVVGYKITGGEYMVQRLEGNTLVNVSTEPAAPKNADYLTLISDKTGLPYLIYRDNGFIAVKKLVNDKWEQTVKEKASGSYKAAFDSKNVLFLAFKEGKRMVKKLVNETLVDVGPVYYNMSTNEINLAIDNKDNLFVAYTAFEDGTIKIVELEKKAVKGADGKMAYTYDGQTWKQLPDPTADFKKTAGELPVMAFDNQNNMIFACSFRSINTNIVRKFDGTAWVPAQTGIDKDDAKIYSGHKHFSFSPKSNTLYMSRPFYSAKLQ